MSSTTSPAQAAAAASPGSFNIHNNPFKAQRLWPPDFSKMDPKHQFRLERRWRRRAKLAYLRPGWVRGVKLAQYSSVLLVAGYGVFFMDWKGFGEPFKGIRDWVGEKGSKLLELNPRPPPADLGRITPRGSEQE